MYTVFKKERFLKDSLRYIKFKKHGTKLIRMAIIKKKEKKNRNQVLIRNAEKLETASTASGDVK